MATFTTFAILSAQEGTVVKVKVVRVVKVVKDAKVKVAKVKVVKAAGGRCIGAEKQMVSWVARWWPDGGGFHEIS